MNKKEDVKKSLDKLINQLILRSERFIEYSAFPYGLLDLVAYEKKSGKLTYDYEYFVLTKSTKTIKAVRELLRKEFNEDVIVLIRSIFENYLSCRYLHENEDKLNDFIANPVNVALAYYNINPSGEIYDRQNNLVGEIINPNDFKMGMDKRYYYDFYDFLSRFAHCNFGIVESYIEENTEFTTNKVSNDLISRLFAVFVFTKIFELVVTVSGEEFFNRKTEKKCYELVDKSIKLQNTIFELCIQELSDINDDKLKFKNKRMKKMFNYMKKSLNEELGSINKNK